MSTHAQIISSLTQMKHICDGMRRQKQRIALTNGCFDLLHVGHLQGLTFARDQGDLLIVAINDDAAVERLKGRCRPIIPLEMRMAMVAGLRAVDFVIPFGEDSALKVVQTLRPDVYVKGSDYNLEETPEGKCVLGYGGAVVTAPFVSGISTSIIVERIRRLSSSPLSSSSGIDN